MRTIERFNKETSQWESIEFKDLHTGDFFRMFDDGQRYVNKADGSNVWFAIGEPYLNEDNVYTVDTLY
jgi:hypothetical protein